MDYKEAYFKWDINTACVTITILTLSMYQKQRSSQILAKLKTQQSSSLISVDKYFDDVDLFQFS